jgi:hypothetical protein
MFQTDTDRDTDQHSADRSAFQGSTSENDDYHRHVAAEVIAMLPPAREEKRRVLGIVHQILNIELQPPSTDDLRNK